MKVTIDFTEEELRDALQLHFDEQLSVQDYIKAALRFFRDLRRREAEGKSVGFGEKSRFGSYNTVVSPAKYLGTTVLPLPSPASLDQDAPF